MFRKNYLFLSLPFLFLSGWGMYNSYLNYPLTRTTDPLPTEIQLNSLTFRLEKIADGLTSPVGMAHAGDGSGRYFIIEQPGRIRIIQHGQLVNEPFLDLNDKMVSLRNNYTEMGLLGLAFHPEYKTNGRFFVYYSQSATSRGINHTSVLAEYKVNPDNPNKATATERILMRIDQPESNHNGGHLVFGPDGYLYIGLGDGGGAGDRHGRLGNGQDTHTLLGSILRIDVNGTEPYAIPADNPFMQQKGKKEIYAYGLRNPWRFSFDRQDGRLFCGDVGQNKREEVNIIEKGGNYGWRAMEGFDIYDQALYQQGGNFKKPIIDYDHSVGNSITGGYVYRGKKYPVLQGKYIFGDWSGKLFYLEQTSQNNWQRRDFKFSGQATTMRDLRVNSFGEDEAGEIYLIAQDGIGANNPKGAVYRIGIVQ